MDPEIVAVPSTIGKGPRYCIASRYNEKPKAATPGPNYMPKGLGADGPKLSFHGSGKSRDSIPPGPGPGLYNSNQESRSPRFTLKARKFIEVEGHPDGPGPGLYMPNFNSIEPHSPGVRFPPKSTDD